ncbi:glycosyl hydrolases family 31-domain-containing protein [Gaertneriomyces semiglobifer]|nr:glycosyl hydrolases family 31-domain-containing protein [Gaertneriomyces semiglobifer]
MKPRQLFFLTLVLFATLLQVHAVKRHDFKTCAQSAFCRRQRGFASLTSHRPSSYKLSGPPTVQNSVVKGTLHNTQNEEFEFSLDVREDNTVRLRIKENKKDAKARFEVGELAVEKSTFPSPVDVESHTTNGVTNVLFGHKPGEEKIGKIVIHHNPFKLEFWENGVPKVILNNRGYLNYETGQMHNATEQITESDSETIAALKKELYADEGPESFGGKLDSKPHGPQSMGVEHVYGIPEHAAPFSLPATRGANAPYSDPYRLYNLDVFEYELDNPMALYGSVPFMYGHGKAGTSGVYVMNSAEMWVDVEKLQDTNSEAMTSTHWMIESGILDIFIFLGPTPSALTRQYTSVTGRPYLPPLFAIAYHQCRWNYNDEQDVAEVDAGFDEHDIPYDVLWLDIEHTNGKRYFTWDALKFPNPAQMQNQLATRDRKMVVIIDPHIKRDDTFPLYKIALDKKYFVHTANGEVFDGWCWPGSSSWLDYLSPVVRQFWSDRFSLSVYNGSTPSLFVWNDMNEPSVFTGPEITMPKDALHTGGVEHRDVHNLYGALMMWGTFEGLRQREEGVRPFLLSRAFFAGSQRYGAVWTGDNMAEWTHLKASVPMLLSLSTSGITFSGADVGGFFGNPSPELLLRWYQLGAFQPFFRAHAHIDAKRREPWLFGPTWTHHIRNAIRERYKILPYLYTLFWEASSTGMGVMRPMMYEFPSDSRTYAMDTQYMLGSALLVTPVTTPDQHTVDVYLPPNTTWFDYHSHTPYVSSSTGKTVSLSTPMDHIPVLVRAGSVVPTRSRVRRSSSLMKHDPYTLLIALDRGVAKGRLYIDDGRTEAYQSGMYKVVDVNVENRIEAVKVEKVILLGQDEIKQVNVKGQKADWERVGETVIIKVNADVTEGEWIAFE